MDDVLIFYDGFQGDAKKLNTILDLFGRAIGMKINEIKYTLLVHNLEES